MGEIDYLVQGTLYSDVIESGTATAATIKSHHNVGGLPEDMHFELIEPLRPLFKDEVRKVGHELGLPGDIVWRQPFRTWFRCTHTRGNNKRKGNYFT